MKIRVNSPATFVYASFASLSVINQPITQITCDGGTPLGSDCN